MAWSCCVSVCAVVSVRCVAGDTSPDRLVLTPVRRSTRPSLVALPAGLRDHDVIVESVDEVRAANGRERLQFRDNTALQLAWTTASSHADEPSYSKTLITTQQSSDN